MAMRVLRRLWPHVARASGSRGGTMLLAIVIWLLVGAVAGVAAHLVHGDEGLGLLGHVLLGATGAIFGGATDVLGFGALQQRPGVGEPPAIVRPRTVAVALVVSVLFLVAGQIVHGAARDTVRF
jgi:uncharacterized membrane protein YeaQ/YmgE (transglycosylase-associated protein family)